VFNAIAKLIKQLFKWGVASSVGEFKETIGQTLWWGTFVSFAMMAGTFYYTTLRFVAPWFTLDKFAIIVVAVIGLIYAWERRIGVRSLWAHRARQMGMSSAKHKGKGIVVVVSGFFDPLNGKGHITHIQEAKKLGDWLVVILSRDDQVVAKGNKPNGPFYPDITERIAVIRELRSVDEVVVSVDDGITCAETLRLVRPHIFAKGGDRTPDNMPECEIKVCEEIGCQVVYNVGDSKVTSSSELIRRACGGEK